LTRFTKLKKLIAKMRKYTEYNIQDAELQEFQQHLHLMACHNIGRDIGLDLIAADFWK
jgi:hypothetical protein